MVSIYNIEIEIPEEYKGKLHREMERLEVLSWAKSLLKTPFTDLPLQINHINLTLRNFALERLQGDSTLVDIVSTPPKVFAIFMKD